MSTPATKPKSLADQALTIEHARQLGNVVNITPNDEWCRIVAGHLAVADDGRTVYVVDRNGLPRTYDDLSGSGTPAPYPHERLVRELAIVDRRLSWQPDQIVGNGTATQHAGTHRTGYFAA